MKILLTGKHGQVGFDLRRSLAVCGDVCALDRQALDLTDPAAIRNTIRDLRPDVMVNAAGYTAVDRAETEPETAWSVNAQAPQVMAEEAARSGALLIHYSTDYVFDGTKREPYVETDRTHPLNVYGESKLEGERAIEASGAAYLILRTSWVYTTRGHNFLLTVLRLAQQRTELTVVDDQIGAPTWSASLADATAQVLQKALSAGVSLRNVTGVYQLTAAGETSWHGFAEAILDQYARRALPIAGRVLPLTVNRIVPVSTEHYHTLARRPLYSILSNAKAQRVFGIFLPHWREQLRCAWDAAQPEALAPPQLACSRARVCRSGSE